MSWIPIELTTTALACSAAREFMHRMRHVRHAHLFLSFQGQDADMTFLGVVKHINELLIHVMSYFLRLAHQVFDVCLFSSPVELVDLRVLVRLITYTMNHLQIINYAFSELRRVQLLFLVRELLLRHVEGQIHLLIQQLRR